jgi:hypothetical protein
MSKKKPIVELPSTPTKTDSMIAANNTETIDETALFERITAIIDNRKARAASR